MSFLVLLLLGVNIAINPAAQSLLQAMLTTTIKVILTYPEIIGVGVLLWMLEDAFASSRVHRRPATKAVTGGDNQHACRCQVGNQPESTPHGYQTPETQNNLGRNGGSVVLGTGPALREIGV